MWLNLAQGSKQALKKAGERNLSRLVEATVGNARTSDIMILSLDRFPHLSAAAQGRSGAAGASSTAGFGDLPEWDLGDLYPSMDAPELKRDLKKAASDALAFEQRWKGALGAEAAKGEEGRLGEAMREYEALEELIGRIVSYAGLVYSGDTSDPKRVKLYGDVQEKMTDASARLLFFALELNKIEDGAIEAALEANPAFAHYRPWIVDLRKDKPYQLEDRVEQLFHEKSVTGRGAWNRLFDETMTALRFEVAGEKLALEPTLNLLQDADGDVRRKAAEALAATFKTNLRMFTLITNTLAKDKEISDRWRGFDDIADSRHLANRVERTVVDALTEAVRDAYPRLSHRYYSMKARWLGMDQMNHWDRNAPLPDTPQAVIGWDEAKDTVLSAYHGFAPEMAETARAFFDGKWIDAPVRPGKAPGAFAHPTVPSVHPYVLLNYMGKPRDVMTLAHELGHGVHQVLAGGQGALMASTPLTLAETASVFGEMLTFRSLLDRTTDRRERKAMLAQKTEDMINTVVRQVAFYEFERKLHTERRNGELTADRIGEFWLEVQAASLGPAIRLREGYETFWAYIPHFIHSPFYVYAYAFGDCLVNSLYAVYQNAEQGFQEKYFDMLRAGGTKHHSELLAPFGLDASDPAFWQKGMSVIEGLIDELDALDRG
jgi:oligoendopeptidase F